MHHHDQHRKAPLLPHRGCLLQLPEGTVTNQLKRELVIAKRGPPLRALLRNKFHWTPEVEATTDWNLHDQAIRNTRQKFTFIKFFFGYLPVGWRVNKYDPKYSETCASCKHLEPTVETIAHLQDCLSESRTKWRCVIQQQVSVSLEQWHTHPDLLSFFLRCFATAVDKDPPPQLTDTNPLFHGALQEQAAIGWPQLLQGRWSKQWQSIHLKTHTTPVHSKKKPEHWSNAILKTAWENWFRHVGDPKQRQAWPRCSHSLQQLKESNSNVQNDATLWLATLFGRPQTTHFSDSIARNDSKTH